MRGFLIDENLPADLARWLGGVCVHAAVAGDQLSDLNLWEYARRNDLIILTKDADFFDLLSLQGSPPKVVWVRTGNLRRLELESLLRQRWSEIVTLIKDADLVEVHDDRTEAIRF